MKATFWKVAFVSVFAIFFVAVWPMAGMDAGKRLAIIKALKIEGVVGENNKGYLEFKGAPKAKEVVDEENSVRKKAYEAVAASTKVSVGQVSAQRAAQLASESPAGTWIQLPDGRWAKK